MILDLERDEAPAGFRPDVGIIGAGAAGIVLALELARRGRQVLLLESGGRKYEPRSQALYGALSVGAPYTGHTLGRIRALGGSTLDWGGQIVEIDAHVFAQRGWIPGSGWPVSKSELDPFFARALTYECLDDAPDPAADLPPAPHTDALFVAATKFCPTLNFFDLHRSELDASRSIVVLHHANVVEIDFNDATRFIDRIECRTLGGRSFMARAPRWVMCVGGIETSRLLLQPRPGGMPPWQASGWLGRSYVDHLVAPTIDFPANFALGPRFEYFWKAGVKFHPKIKVKPHMQAARGLLDAAATISPIHRDGERLQQAFETYRMLKKRKFDRVRLRDIGRFGGAAPELAWHVLPINARLRRLRAPTAWRLAVHCEQAPQSGGSITLGAERDALGLLRARIDWRIDDLEIRTIRETTAMVAAAVAPLQGGVGVSLIVDDDDASLRAGIVENFHHIGGARMSGTPAGGVVDPELRVFGVNNLYICSTAAFPSGGFANPTHTLLALTLRLADTLVSEPVHVR